MKERADKVLVARGLIATRAQAKSLIELGRVSINGKAISKAGELVEEDAEFVVDSPDYVGRGAFKLEAALEQFKISVSDKTLIDIGASTGGFTEVLLRAGAKKVFAVDVGRGQLAEKLRADPRVDNMEATHILDVNFILPVDGAVIDLSFISLTKVIAHVHTLLSSGAFVIALVKPQFEAGLERLPKDGVVKDEGVRQEILREVISSCEVNGFTFHQTIDSPIEGKTGNREWLVYLTRN